MRRRLALRFSLCGSALWQQHGRRSMRRLRLWFARPLAAQQFVGWWFSRTCSFMVMSSSRCQLGWNRPAKSTRRLNGCRCRGWGLRSLGGTRLSRFRDFLRLRRPWYLGSGGRGRLARRGRGKRRRGRLLGWRGSSIPSLARSSGSRLRVGNGLALARIGTAGVRGAVRPLVVVHVHFQPIWVRRDVSGHPHPRVWRRLRSVRAPDEHCA